jgi:hypothetical protein
MKQTEVVGHLERRLAGSILRCRRAGAGGCRHVRFGGRGATAGCGRTRSDRRLSRYDPCGPLALLESTRSANEGGRHRIQVARPACTLIHFWRTRLPSLAAGGGNKMGRATGPFISCAGPTGEPARERIRLIVFGVVVLGAKAVGRRPPVDSSLCHRCRR